MGFLSCFTQNSSINPPLSKKKYISLQRVTKTNDKTNIVFYKQLIKKTKRMKKILSLIAMAVMAIGASAQNSWVAPAELPAAGSKIVNNDLLSIYTVYEAKGGDKDSDGNPFTINFSDTKTYTTVFQVRVDAAPLLILLPELSMPMVLPLKLRLRKMLPSRCTIVVRLPVILMLPMTERM